MEIRNELRSSSLSTYSSLPEAGLPSMRGTCHLIEVDIAALAYRVQGSRSVAVNGSRIKQTRGAHCHVGLTKPCRELGSGLKGGRLRSPASLTRRSRSILPRKTHARLASTPTRAIYWIIHHDLITNACFNSTRQIMAMNNNATEDGTLHVLSFGFDRVSRARALGRFSCATYLHAGRLLGTMSSFPCHRPTRARLQKPASLPCGQTHAKHVRP
jgi:hypothetical protein